MYVLQRRPTKYSPTAPRPSRHASNRGVGVGGWGRTWRDEEEERHVQHRAVELLLEINQQRTGDAYRLQSTRALFAWLLRYRRQAEIAYGRGISTWAQGGPKICPEDERPARLHLFLLARQCGQRTARAIGPGRRCADTLMIYSRNCASACPKLVSPSPALGPSPAPRRASADAWSSGARPRTVGGGAAVRLAGQPAAAQRPREVRPLEGR